MIYLTPFNPDTLKCTGPSLDSGFSTLDEVRQMMGEPDMAHKRMLTYEGNCFTDFVLHLEPELTRPATPCHTGPNSVSEQ